LLLLTFKKIFLIKF